jgi:DNA glycosylase AlkZ-like
MSLTGRQLNRTTLDRQMLLRREPTEVIDAIRRVVALQAQEAASPYLALWNRIAGFDAADLDAAFADRAVVKAPLMRLTLHAVHAEDWPAFHAAMSPSLRASRLFDRRFRSTGLSTADADDLLGDLATFLTRPRTDGEVERMLESRLGERQPRLWWALRRFAPLHHVPTGGPWSFDARSYVTAATALDPDGWQEATQRLVLRYLEGFGPASSSDVAQFTMLRRPVVAMALAALDGDVVELSGPRREKLFDTVGAPLADEGAAAPPRLLPMWDSILLAYADRGRVIPPAYRPLVIRRNGDVLATLLVDGYVAGVWRRIEEGIEATAFHQLDDSAWAGLAAEASGLVALLDDREPTVYRRYAHWWSTDLPGAEVRILPG